jgi:type III pantothenate kinase
MLLADIGNTHFHILDNDKVLHLSYDEAIERYRDKKLNYISVKRDLTFDNPNWIDISSKIRLEGEYNTMGVDRKALCLSKNSGIFVDAGSAITVDIVIDREYIGGFILLGLKAHLKAYKDISPILDIELNKSIDLNTLPKNTIDNITYAIIEPLRLIIQKHKNTLPLYFTGGDGEFLSSFFDDGIYSDRLVFEGIMLSLP